jgi:hypothetical protein
VHLDYWTWLMRICRSGGEGRFPEFHRGSAVEPLPVANTWMSGSQAEFQGGRLDCSNNSFTQVLAKRRGCDDVVVAMFLVRSQSGLT